MYQRTNSFGVTLLAGLICVSLTSHTQGAAAPPAIRPHESQDLTTSPVKDHNWSRLESSVWILDGDPRAPRVVYVFSDPNCPYCHKFWDASRPWVNAGKVQLRHILVGIIKKDSPSKAAAILSAPDRLSALKSHEQRSGHGGISPVTNIAPDIEKILDHNRTLMLSLGFSGVTAIVSLDGSARVKKSNGMPREPGLVEVLGPL